MKHELYAQLLASLTQGGEPFPTEEEYRRWKESWVKAHPGEQIWYGDERLPWPIRRYLALQLLHAFTWPNWLRLAEAIYEDDSEAEDGEPFKVEQARDPWHRWREAVIKIYRLEGLVTVEQENSDHH